MTTINAILSGLGAASLRAAVSAGNLANIQTTSTRAISDPSGVNRGPYVPQDVIQISQTEGGTLASVVSSGKDPVQTYDPSSGVTSLPNIDIAEELVKTDQASTEYKSLLSALNVYQQTQKSLLDIFA